MVLTDPYLFDNSIWGLVAPARFFAGKYTVSYVSLPWIPTAKLIFCFVLQWLYLGFPIGAVLPFLAYLLHRKYPGKSFDRVIWPIVLDGGQTVPQA